MARKPKDAQALPELNEIESEMSQVRSKGRFRQSLKGTFGTLLVVVAIAVIVAFILLPVLKITNGHNMEPGLQPGDIVLLYKTNKAEKGDICAFYFNNKLLLRRVIAKEGDVVDIDEHGYVKVNDEILEENSYISEHTLGQSDIDYPFHVRTGRQPWLCSGQPCYQLRLHCPGRDLWETSGKNLPLQQSDLVRVLKKRDLTEF